MISFFILLYNKYGDTTMDRHIKKDISWWVNDPLMRSHVGENAYLYIDKEFKEECSDDFLKLMQYGYSHHRYLDLLSGGYEYIRMDDVEEFERTHNVINLYRKVLPTDVRKIEMQFEEICFYWMQPAKVAVDYINEHYEEENIQQQLYKRVEEKVDNDVDIKQYKLVRSGNEC